MTPLHEGNAEICIRRDCMNYIAIEALHAQLRVMHQVKINMNPVLYYKQDEHAHY